MATFKFSDALAETQSTFSFEEALKETQSAAPVAPTPTPARPTPQQIERVADVSVTPPITGEGGAAFGIYPRPSAKRPTPTLTPVVEEAKAPVAQPAPYTPRDFTALDKAIETITPKAGPSVTAPVEGEMGAAFGMYPKQPMGGRTTGIKTETAAQNPEVTSFIAEYMKERRPNVPLAKDPVKLVEDFKDMMSKNTMDRIREFTYVANASPKQKELTVKAYELAKKMDTDVNDTVVREMLDVTNWIGGGVGFAYKQFALRGAQSVAKIQLKTVGVTAATEGAVAGAQSTVQQKTDIALGLQDEFSYASLAASVGLSAAVEGVVGGRAAATLGGARKTSERIAELRATKAVDIDAKNDEWMTKFLAKEKEVVEGPAPLYESAEARQQAREESLNVIGEPTDVTDPVLNKPIITDIFKVAKQYFKDNPDARPDLNQVRVTQAIVDALSTADVDSIQQAASRAGVKPAEFLEAFKVQASEAGAYLQQASALGRFLRNMTEGDPELEDAFKKMFNAGSGVSYWTGRAVETTKKGTGASVAASTAGLSTAVLNAIGLTGTVGIQTAGDILESAVRVGGRMINDLRGDGPPVNAARIKEDIGEIFADGGYVLSRMLDAGYTRELSELAIKNNPRLNNLINNMSVEADLTGANEVLQAINIFNRAVDGVVRRPILMQSIKNRMKDVGLDYEEYLASDKPIPASLIKAAVDDTMKLTFSYNFKKTGEKSIEGFAEDAAFKVLQTINQNAGVGVVKDLLTPFIRFQLNAVRYTYRMTPFSGWGGIQELEKAAKLRSEGKLAEAAGLSYDGKRKVLDSVVSTAAITAAAVYRQENADTQFYQVKDKDGNIVDVSGAFPYSNMMAMGEMMNVMADLGKELWYTAKMTPEERAQEADAILKQAEALDVNDPARQRLLNQYELLGLSRVRNFDGAKFGEVIAGLGRMAGVQQSVFNTVAEAIEGGITESAERKAGSLVGDFVSRFDNVLNPIYDAINFMRDDMRVVDPKASTTLSGQVSPGVEAAIGPIVAPIPGARDILQDRPSLFQEEQVNVPTVVRQFTGIRPTAPTTPVENELIRLNIQPYTVFKTSGNRDYDNIRIAFARPIFLGGTTQLVEQDRAYRQLSANEQQVAIKTRINEAFNETREMARDYFIQTKGEAAVDALYQKADNRQAQEDRFVKLFKRKPQTPAEKMMIVDGEFNVAKEAGKFNKGGLATQTAQALSKRQ